MVWTNKTAGIVKKIKAAAYTDYDGEVYENIYEIFLALPIADRRSVLKMLLNVCFIAEHDLMLNSRGFVAVRSMEESMAEDTKAELAALEIKATEAAVATKATALKILLIGLSFSITLFVATASYFSTEEEKLFDSLDAFYEDIISIMFGT